MNYFIILLIVILVIIYIGIRAEYFTSGYEPNTLSYGLVDYQTREQNCGELTYVPNKCSVNTVVPSNEVVCNESLTPITNNDLINEKKQIKEKNPTLGLEYNFDLLSSFNNSQIKLNSGELETFEDLKTDVKSLGSLENDLLSNY